MMMMKTLVSAIAMACASQVVASEFLPVNQGDSANFSGTRGMTRELRIDDSASGWRHVLGFPLTGASWIYSDPLDTRAYVYNDDTHSSVLLADFARPIGTRFNLALSGCNNTATIGAKNLALSVPAGSFQRVTRLDFGSSCADAGLMSAWFAPNVGLVKWSESNIAGALEFVLNNARIGATNIGQSPTAANGIRVSAVLPGPTVLNNVVSHVGASLKVENVGTRPVTFTCPTTQEFDISIRNAAGDIVNTWSATRRFAGVTSSFTVAAGASKEVGGEVDLTSLATNAPLDVGSYTIGIELRCQITQQASAFQAVPSYSAQGPLFVDKRVGF